MLTESQQTYVDWFGNILTVDTRRQDHVQDNLALHGRRRAKPGQEVGEWNSLAAGEHVVLRRGRTFVSSGIIEDVMHDGSAFWIYIPREFRRSLVHLSEGLAVFRAGI